MIKIGYLGSYNDSGNLHLSADLGLEILEDCKPTPIILLKGLLTHCPAVKGYHLNTYEVKCPFNLEWTVSRNADGSVDWKINPDKTTIDLNKNMFLYEKGLDILGFDPEATVVQVLLHPGWSFVSDTPNTIMLQHSNGIDTNPQIVTGQKDIYKWPDRQLSVGYSLEHIKDKHTFTLKQGQPWYRVTFFVPDLRPVKLVRMKERPLFLKNTRQKSTLTAIKKLDWRKIFTDFGNSRPKKLIP